MKVYVVYGNLDRNDYPDYEIHGIFADYEKAVEYATKIGTEAFDKCDILQHNRNTDVNFDGKMFAIVDGYNYQVELYVVEREVQ